MKKELKYGVLSADCRPTVGGVNVIAVLVDSMVQLVKGKSGLYYNLVSLSHATK